MQVTETLSDGLKREYAIVIEADEIENKLSGKLNELAKEAQIPGFRRGKVPVSLLRKTYGKRVMGEVVEESVNEATAKTFEDNELKPAMQPKIEITSFDEGKDLEYKLEVELLPEFEVGSFADLELERPVAEVEDKALEERLEAMAQQMKSFADGADGQEAASGDAVVIDFVGSVDGTPFEGGAADDFQLELGSGQFIPGFEDQLIGVKAGDEKTVEVTFPEEYGDDKLAGKPASFAVTVKAVKVPLPTPVDDALAEKFGLENLEKLREAVKTDMEQAHGQLSRNKLKRSLLDALADRYDFEVPPGMVDMEFDQIWHQLEHDLEHQNKTVADLDKPEEEMRTEYRGIAERRVRLGLLLSEVGRANNLEVSDDEVSRAIMQQAQRFPGQERQVFEYLRDNEQAQAQLRAPILEDKVCDFIIEMAQVTDKTVSLDELMAEPEEDGHEHHDHDHKHD